MCKGVIGAEVCNANDGGFVVVYRHVGEWYEVHKEKNGSIPHDGLPTEEFIHNASSTLFITAGVYGGFIVLSLICIGAGRRKTA